MTGTFFLDSLIRGLERRLSNNKAKSAAGIRASIHLNSIETQGYSNEGQGLYIGCMQFDFCFILDAVLMPP